MRRAVFGLTVLLVSSFGGYRAHAQEQACPDNQTTEAAIDCLSNALDVANSALSAKLAAVRGLAAMANFKDEFDRSQNAWEAYVKQACDGLLDPFWEGGSIRIPAVLSCKVELTQERTTDLDRMFYVPLHD